MEKLGITEQMLFCTIRIETEYANGTTGIGTGFIYRANAKKKENGETESQPVIITNKHVVENAIKTTFYLHVRDEEGNFSGKVRQVSLQKPIEPWILLSDLDIAFCGLGPIIEMIKSEGLEVFYKGIEKDALLGDIELKEVMPGSEIFMVGYPDGLSDERNYLPLVRRGILSSNIKFDFNGKKEFVIDAACFPGSSGSSVFLSCFGHKITKEGVSMGECKINLLGILWGGPITDIDGRMIIKNIPLSAITTPIPLSLGYCIKTNAFIEKIEKKIEEILKINEKQKINLIQKELCENKNKQREMGISI